MMDTSVRPGEHLRRNMAVNRFKEYAKKFFALVLLIIFMVGGFIFFLPIYPIVLVSFMPVLLANITVEKDK